MSPQMVNGNISTFFMETEKVENDPSRICVENILFYFFSTGLT